ncbi:MAG: CRISPR system precrRNA processing endoribonuclease RAMP protein Cas6 [Pseudonocardia sp.]|nr:CRISPR system precrRNA processing endoribonuclease RAMP protein Cas6 [Pseudonocardia sp.]
MPTVLELDLDVTVAPTVYPARLHGAACALLGHPPPGGTPDFSAWPLVAHGERARWRLGWLPDRACPAPPAAVTFGSTVHRVVDHAITHVGFAELAAGPPARRADVDVLSPLYFSRNGRDLPLPDPELMLRSSLDRWDRHAPPALRVPDDVRRALLGAVYLVACEGGTVTGAVGARMRQTGFTGTVTLGLTRSAGPAVAGAFAALIRYAAVTGIGAQTAHGFGAVRTRLHRGARTDQQPEPRRRRGPRGGVSAGESWDAGVAGGSGDHLDGAGDAVLAGVRNAAGGGR